MCKWIRFVASLSAPIFAAGSRVALPNPFFLSHFILDIVAIFVAIDVVPPTANIGLTGIGHREETPTGDKSPHAQHD
jgi:hypothetical protein